MYSHAFGVVGNRRLRRNILNEVSFGAKWDQIQPLRRFFVELLVTSFTLRAGVLLEWRMALLGQPTYACGTAALGCEK
jgi:hypothetical protein